MSIDVSVKAAGPLAPLGTRDEVEALADELMGALIACDVVDPSIGVSFDGDDVLIEFDMTVDTGDLTEAVDRAMTSVRSVLHGAGHRTPDWEQMTADMRRSVSASEAPTDHDGDLVDA